MLFSVSFYTYGQQGAVSQEVEREPGIEQSVGGVGMFLHPAVGPDDTRVGQDVHQKEHQTEEQTCKAPAVKHGQ